MKSPTQNKIKKDGLIVSGMCLPVQLRKIIVRCLSVCLILFISACTTIDTKSFDAFNVAVDDIITIDTVIKPHVETVKLREMYEISGNIRKINQLALDFDSENLFGYEYKFSGRNDEPLFMKLKRFDEALIELNSAFEKYAYLLATLAGDERISEDEFRQLGSDLNSNLNNAVKKFNQNEKVTSSGFALFSTIASTAAFEAVQRNRKDMLIKILDDNQEIINAAIEHAQAAIRITRNEIVAEYELTRDELIDAYTTANREQQEQISYEMLAASEQTVAALEMLKAFNETYTVLAFSHRQLSIGLKTNRLPSFGSLKDAIENVWKRYKDLKQVNDMGSGIDQPMFTPMF